MIKETWIYRLEHACNTAGAMSMMALLIGAFIFQIVLHELPCPLCLLQRIGFVGMALGFLMNSRFGLRPSHYSIVLFSAILTALIALRQIALHIEIGSAAYGDPIFGLHLYTWSFIISALVIMVTTFMLGSDRQYLEKRAVNNVSRMTHVLLGLLFLLVAANLVSVILECGFGINVCPDNPTHYAL